jgi:hypothetical protein
MHKQYPNVISRKEAEKVDARGKNESEGRQELLTVESKRTRNRWMAKQ